MGALALQSNDTVLAVPDALVLQAAREADNAALQSIYEANAPAITRRLAHLTGDPDLARDLTQDTFVVAFERLHRFREDASLASWLHGIAFNLLRDRRKRARRQRSIWARLSRSAADPPSTPEPERALQSQQDLARLQTILAGLDDRLRDAFVLRVVEQLSLEETANILGIRIATVSYRARRAETLVRAAFEERSDR